MNEGTKEDDRNEMRLETGISVFYLRRLPREPPFIE